MPFVACPSCGERGKIPPTLVGARIKCKKCGISFNVAPSAAKAAVATGAATGSEGTSAEASASATATPHEGIAIEGLDAGAWAVANDTPDALKAAPAEQDQGTPEAADGVAQFVAHVATGHKEYKLLTPRDKIFEGKFDLGRLEEALNYYARQGWIVKAMSTPHVKGFTGVLQEEFVVLLER